MITVQSSNFGFTGTLRTSVKKGKYEMRSHLHQFSELLLVLDGEITVSKDGKEETARAGDVVIVPPFALHGFYTPSYSHIWLAVFSNDFISDFSQDTEYYYNTGRSVFTPSNEVLNLLKSRMIDTKEELITCDREQFRMIKAALYAVHEEYARTVPEFKVLKKSGALSTALKVISYMREHFREKVSLVGVAKELNYNPEYVSRCLGEIRGMNFRYLLNSIRADHAKLYLLHTERTVADIAVECGFSGERSFHRVFASMTGLTPGEFRRKRDHRL
ncbi:MAG: AraC family transcriptional regulator [Clostridia bacterium]|nr:AraC family transcriptional regulator [Clostridia bacterium]